MIPITSVLSGESRADTLPIIYENSFCRPHLSKDLQGFNLGYFYHAGAVIGSRRDINTSHKRGISSKLLAFLHSNTTRSQYCRAVGNGDMGGINVPDSQRRLSEKPLRDAVAIHIRSRVVILNKQQVRKCGFFGYYGLLPANGSPYVNSLVPMTAVNSNAASFMAI